MEITLEQDEQIIIRSPEILWISDRGQKMDDFVLTSKGLYCCYKQKNGLFSKPEPVIYRFELSDIVVEDQVSHIEQVKANNERCIQIQFRHGMEHFSFQRVPKKAMDDWFGAFQQVLGVPDLTSVQRARNKEMLNNLAGDVIDGVGSLIGAGSKAILDKLGQMSENTRSPFPGSSQKSEPKQTQTPASSESHGPTEYTYYEEVPGEACSEEEEAAFCVYCGTKLSADAVFCYACGKKVPEAEKPAEKSIPTPPPVPVPYYLAIDGQPKGPFEMDEIRELAFSGQINRATLAWTKGMENWKTIDEIEGLKEIAENMPPVLM